MTDPLFLSVVLLVLAIPYAAILALVVSSIFFFTKLRYHQKVIQILQPKE